LPAQAVEVGDIDTPAKFKLLGNVGKLVGGLGCAYGIYDLKEKIDKYWKDRRAMRRLSVYR
jgi:hypothetical protein